MGDDNSINTQSKGSIRFKSLTTLTSDDGSTIIAKPLASVQSSTISGPNLVKSIYSVATVLNTKTQIGLVGCIVVILSCVLGSGIFAAPQEILNITGNNGLTLIIWFTYGIIALVAALCYVELGTTFPVSGGDYAYLNECFGTFPAFLFQWSNNFIITPVITAILSIVVAKNLINPYTRNPDGPEALWASKLLAMAILLFFCYINCKSAAITERLQGWLMIVNIITITFIVCCGIVHMIQKGVDADFTIDLPQPPPEKKMSSEGKIKYQTLKIVSALYQSSFSYFGYTYLGYITEELENPLRNLPLGVLISIPIIIFLNIFVNFCYIATLSTDTIKKTKTISNEMFRAVLPPAYQTSLGWLAPTLVAIAVTGGLSSNILTCSRISFTGARNGHFPEMFSLVHSENSTPIVSIVWIGMLACLFVLVGNIPTLIGVGVYIEAAYNCACIYGLLYMRYKSPGLHRPIKLPLILPISYAFIATILFFVPIIAIDGDNAESTLTSIGGAIFTLFTGIPLYFMFIYRKRDWKVLNKIQGHVIVFLQKLFYLVPPQPVYEMEFEIVNYEKRDQENQGMVN